MQVHDHITQKRQHDRRQALELLRQYWALRAQVRPDPVRLGVLRRSLEEMGVFGYAH